MAALHRWYCRKSMPWHQLSLSSCESEKSSRSQVDAVLQFLEACDQSVRSSSGLQSDCRVWRCSKLVSMRTETNFFARRVVSILVVSFCLVGLLLPGVVFADQAPVAKAHHKSTKKVAKQLPQTKSPPAVPSGPLEALPLDQIPSSAPQVKYE